MLQRWQLGLFSSVQNLRANRKSRPGEGFTIALLNQSLDRSYITLRDLYGTSIALLIQSLDRSLDGVGTGIKLQHDEPTFPKQIDRLNSYLFPFNAYVVGSEVETLTRLLSRYDYSVD